MTLEEEKMKMDVPTHPLIIIFQEFYGELDRRRLNPEEGASSREDIAVVIRSAALKAERWHDDEMRSYVETIGGVTKRLQGRIKDLEAELEASYETICDLDKMLEER